MTNTYKVLSIDAWTDTEPNSWTWNNWFNAGTIEIDINADKQTILQAMNDNGYITQTKGGEVEDDGFNLVIVDENTREPIFAIEYGTTI